VTGPQPYIPHNTYPGHLKGKTLFHCPAFENGKNEKNRGRRYGVSSLYFLPKRRWLEVRYSWYNKPRDNSS
jgi:hypothetical protein